MGGVSLRYEDAVASLAQGGGSEEVEPAHARSAENSAGTRHGASADGRSAHHLWQLKRAGNRNWVSADPFCSRSRHNMVLVALVGG